MVTATQLLEEYWAVQTISNRLSVIPEVGHGLKPGAMRQVSVGFATHVL
jgi:hypothetical protein